jgi:hypothetical protein
MTQYTEKATTLMKNTYQELQTSTTALQQSNEATFNQIHQTKQQAFETTCTAIIDQSDHKYQEKIDAAIQQVDIDIDKRTMQLCLDANDTEHRLNILQDELADEAQLILNQLPLDMAIIKQELEDELRTYGNLVRQDLPTEHQLRTLGSSLIS